MKNKSIYVVLILCFSSAIFAQNSWSFLWSSIHSYPSTIDCNFSNNKIIVSGNNGVNIYDFLNGSENQSGFGYLPVKFSNNGKYIVYQSYEGKYLKMMDSKTFLSKWTINIGGTLADIVFSNDDSKIFYTYDNNIRCVKSSDGSQIWSKTIPNKLVPYNAGNILKTLLISNTGNILVTSSDDGIIRIWDTGGNKIKEIEAASENSNFGLSVNFDGTNIIYRDKDKNVVVYNRPNNSIINQISQINAFDSFFSRDGSKFFIVDNGTRVCKVYNLTSKTENYKIDSVYSAVLNYSGTELIVCCISATPASVMKVKVFDPNNGHEIWSSDQRIEFYAANAIISPDDSKLVIFNGIYTSVLTNPPVVILNNFKGDDCLPANSKKNIEWKAIGVPLVDLYYSADNGNSWNLIADNIDSQKGSYQWKIPVINSKACRIKIASSTDQTIIDTSISNFRIFNNNWTAKWNYSLEQNTKSAFVYNSPGGSFLISYNVVSGLPDTTKLRVFDRKTGSMVWQKEFYEDNSTAHVLIDSVNNEILFSYNSSLYEYNIPDGALINKFDFANGITNPDLRINDNSSKLIFVSGGKFYVYDWNSKTELWNDNVDANMVDIEFSPGSYYIVSIDNHLKLKSWQVFNGQLLWYSDSAINGPYQGRLFQFDKSGNNIYVIRPNGVIRVLDLFNADILFESSLGAGQNQEFTYYISPDLKNIVTNKNIYSIYGGLKSTNYTDIIYNFSKINFVKEGDAFLTQSLYLINTDDQSILWQENSLSAGSSYYADLDSSYIYGVTGGTSYKIFVYGTNKIVSVKENKIPDEYKLYQNYPNPFNPVTIIKYSIPAETLHSTSLQNVNLKIFDVLGREITTLVNEKQAPGNYEVKFDGSRLSSGVYFYRLSSGDYSQVKKMLLIK